MKTVFFAGLALAAGLSITSVAFAQDDDWEYQEDAARQIQVAAARYDAGQVIVVQCREGGLTVVLTGLPQSTGSLHLLATRADGRAVEQTWEAAGSPGAWRSQSPGRDVRFLRGGGLYSVQTEAGVTPAFRGAFDLPTQSANLDRVLTGCGWAMADDRDLLAEAKVELEASAGRSSRGSARRGVRPGGPPRPGPASGAPQPTIPVPERRISCIVRALHLRECRAVHPGSAENPAVLRVVREIEGEEVRPIEGTDAATNEGRVIYFSTVRVAVAG